MNALRNAFSKTPSSSPQKSREEDSPTTPASCPKMALTKYPVLLAPAPGPSEMTDIDRRDWVEDSDSDEEFDNFVQQLRDSPHKTLYRSPLKKMLETSSRSPSLPKTNHPRSMRSPSGSPLASPSKRDRNPFDPDDDELDSSVWTDLKQSVADFKSTFGTFRRREGSRYSNSNTGSYQAVAGADQELDSVRSTSSQGSMNSNWDVTDDDDEDDPNRPLSKREHEEMDLRRQERWNDLVAELGDTSLLEPTGSDKHDELMQEVFLDFYAALPPSLPARHMHIIDINLNPFSGEVVMGNSEANPILKHISPRLCDAVATILYNLDPAALSAFLDPTVVVFEWYRRKRAAHQLPSFALRRVGKEVTTGSFRNHGFKYVWGYYVKSTIDDAGKWMETYASSTMATSEVTREGLDWNTFKLVDSSNAGASSDESDASQEEKAAPEEVVTPEEDASQDYDCTKDPRFALYLGRRLAWTMLDCRAWMYTNLNQMHGDVIEWVADGKVTRVKTRDEQIRDVRDVD